MRHQVKEESTPNPVAAALDVPPAYLGALSALKDCGADFLILRFPVPNVEPTRDLDILIAPRSLRRAVEALRMVEFRPLTAPVGLPSKVELVSYDGNSFLSLDVHTTVQSGGLVYLDAKWLLDRRVTENGLPVLSPEDSLMHLIFHPLLSGHQIGGKYSERIREITGRKLDNVYIERHLSRFGLRDAFKKILAAVLGTTGLNPAKIWPQVRRQLLIGVPGNALRRVRYRLAGRVALRRRAGLVAFLGVDGVGKSTLVATLQRLLSERGLRTASVYMGSWGNFQTGASWVGSYSPRDCPPEGETRAQALERLAKNVPKFGLFYGGLVYEQAARYRRGVVRATSDIVLSDRYLYDLEISFSRGYVRAGRRLRRWIFRLFPAPDLVFHLQADPHQILARKAELSEEEMRRFDEIYSAVLTGRRVIRVSVDAPAEVLAERILREHWRDLVGACWEHAPPNPVRSFVIS